MCLPRFHEHRRGASMMTSCVIRPSIRAADLFPARIPSICHAETVQIPTSASRDHCRQHPKAQLSHPRGCTSVAGAPKNLGRAQGWEEAAAWHPPLFPAPGLWSGGLATSPRSGSMSRPKLSRLHTHGHTSWQGYNHGCTAGSPGAEHEARCRPAASSLSRGTPSPSAPGRLTPRCSQPCRSG